MSTLRRKDKCGDENSIRFFSIGLCHNDLTSFYQINFNLMHHHKYSLKEIEDMIPWERDIYINLLIAYLKEEKDKQQKNN